MTKFAGFDTDRVAALHKAISAAVAAADNLSVAVGRNVDGANSIIAAAQGLPPTSADRYPSSEFDANRAGLRAVRFDGGAVAGEVGRRLAYLLGCEQLQHDGFDVDTTAVFADAPAPSEAKVKSTLGQFQSAMSPDDIGRTDPLTALIGQIGGLDPVETEAFVSRLSAEQLGQLNLALDFPQFLDMGIPNDQRLELTDSLLARISRDQVQRLAANVAAMEPDARGYDDNKVVFAWVDAPLYDGPPTPDQLSQGNVGDCWFLSAINAELKQDPNFVQDHLRDNGNGTYTVTFYQKGKPVEVTVDGTVPTLNDGGEMPFAHGDPNWGPSGPLWPAIYEKAFAQLNGGYQHIDGGQGSVGMSELTGRESTRVSPAFTPLSLVAEELADGHPVTVGTKSHSTGLLWWQHNDEYVDANQLVTSHEYAVESVDPGAEPPTITLRNPWGPDSAAPQFVTLTQAQYEQYVGDVDFGDS